MAHRRRLRALGRHLAKTTPTHALATASASAEDPAATRRAALMPQRLAHFEEHGYVIVDDMVDPAAMPRLLAAAQRLQAAVNRDDGTLDMDLGLAARAGGGEAASIRGLLSPEWGMPEVAEYLGSGPVVDYIEGWLRTPLDELQMWSYYPLLLCSPSESDSPGGWHRVRAPSHPLPAAPLRPRPARPRPLSWLRATAGAALRAITHHTTPHVTNPAASGRIRAKAESETHPSTDPTIRLRPSGRTLVGPDGHPTPRRHPRLLRRRGRGGLRGGEAHLR
eukprot:COSAG04_NODE_402_length_14902_cov_9.662771_11_plen_278_part_00